MKSAVKPGQLRFPLDVGGLSACGPDGEVVSCRKKRKRIEARGF